MILQVPIVLIVLIVGIALSVVTISLLGVTFAAVGSTVAAGVGSIRARLSRGQKDELAEVLPFRARPTVGPGNLSGNAAA